MSKQGDWKNRMLTLQETAFFGLMRNYLGNLQTPFNKHHIFEELTGFLNRPGVQNALAASLDELDHRILTVVSLLGRATEAPVLDLLTDRWSPWELRQRLTNLQERLLLYKDSRDLYYLTPPLEDHFRRHVIQTEWLFPSQPRQEGTDELPWLGDGLLLAFYAYLFHTPPSLKGDGAFTKRSKEEWEACFPRFAQDRAEWELFLAAAAAEGLWEAAPGGWILQETAWKRLKALSVKERTFRLWTRAAMVGGPRPHGK